MDWQSVVRSIAPVLGTALGGPMGGAAAKFIGDKLLGDPEATVDDIEKLVVNANPEKLAELKALDNEFKAKMKQLDIDVFKLENEDRQGARELFKVDKRPQMALSALFIIGYFVILGLLMGGTITIADAMRDTVILLLGILTREVPTIMQFWFGSSSGSKDKSKQGS